MSRCSRRCRTSRRATFNWARDPPACQALPLAAALPPASAGGKAVFPGIQPVGADPQPLGDHFRGLAAGQPVVNGFAFERFIEFTTDLDGWLCHGLVGSLSTQFSVRQFEAALQAYQSAWLKLNFPAEFMAAVLTNGKGFYDPLVYVLESHRLGLKFLRRP